MPNPPIWKRRERIYELCARGTPSAYAAAQRLVATVDTDVSRARLAHAFEHARRRREARRSIDE